MASTILLVLGRIASSSGGLNAVMSIPWRNAPNRSVQVLEGMLPDNRGNLAADSAGQPVLMNDQHLAGLLAVARIAWRSSGNRVRKSRTSIETPSSFSTMRAASSD